MVWSLNTVAVKRYLENEEFRQYLNKKSAIPTQQLLFRYTPSPCTVTNELHLEVIRASNIGCLDIGFNTQLMELPSLLRLQALSVSWCQSLERLGDYPNLKTLEIMDCPRLGRIGKSNRLHKLLLAVLTTNCVLSIEQLLLQFPLEHIKGLFINYAAEPFFKLAGRLAALKSLGIFFSTGSELPFPGELFPSLTTLETYNCPSLRLAGMTRLRNLKINGTPRNQIFGKEVVYPQLKSFSHLCISNEPAEQDDSFLSLLKNVTRLTITRSQPITQSDFLLSANNKVSSLDLSMKGQEVIIPDRSFERLSLRNCKSARRLILQRFRIWI
jgi:Leucine-rich repeat (LRR) protein